jgi:hypothetical protein
MAYASLSAIDGNDAFVITAGALLVVVARPE